MSDLKQTVYLRQSSSFGPWVECEKSHHDAVAFDRRTQPEATAPAQDLSAAILALPLPDAWFRSMKRGGMLSEDGYSLAQVQELLKAAAALASSANALSAGDRVDALIALLRKALEESVIGRGSYGLTYDGNLLARDIRSAILQSQNEGSHD